MRLTAETLDVTPDQAAAYILDGPAANPLIPGTAVVARIVCIGREDEDIECRVRQPGTDQEYEATLGKGDVLAVWDFQRRSLRIGDSVAALVLPRQKKAPEHGDTTAQLSPTAPELVERILAGCVPELTTGHIRVMKIARCAGARTKVAVARTGWVDARGACIGSGGKDMGRITCALKMLNRGVVNEKIEIIDYAADQTTYLSFAMAPAKAKLSDILIESGCAVVVVPHHQMHNVIGEGGLNAELAGKLTGLRRVDVVLRGNDPRQALDQVIARASLTGGRTKPVNADAAGPMPDRPHPGGRRTG
ncbi:hypothetical protein [Streptomyces sp. NPDC005407]|uniref:hypothetical protein n=1 Tax=Streptomyces sp. NPDC005407 TaxID=3155340 RepID=UPI0033AF55D5